MTEVDTGVNAKKIQAYVETDAEGNYRLFTQGSSNKLWITSACHDELVAGAARIGKTGKELGLFITELPAKDVADGPSWEFRCEPSGVDELRGCTSVTIPYRQRTASRVVMA